MNNKARANALIEGIFENIEILANVFERHECLDHFSTNYVDKRSSGPGYIDRTNELLNRSHTLKQIFEDGKDELQTKDRLKEMLSYFQQLSSAYKGKFQLDSDLKSALELSNKITSFMPKVILTTKEPSKSLLDALYSFYTFIKRSQKAFYANSSVSSLASKIAGEQFPRIKKFFERFIFRMDKEIISVLMNEVTYRAPGHLHEMYMEALKKYALVSNHLSAEIQSEIVSAVAGMKIWQEPVVSLNGDLIRFNKKKEDIESAMNLPLSVLLETKVNKQLQVILEGFFTGMSNQIDGIVDSYHHLFRRFEDTYITLNNSLQSVIKKSIIDEDFIV